MPPRNLLRQKRNQGATDSPEDALVSETGPSDGHLASSVRGHFAATLSEFIGTFLFLFVSLPACWLWLFGSHLDVSTRPGIQPADQTSSTVCSWWHARRQQYPEHDTCQPGPRQAPLHLPLLWSVSGRQCLVSSSLPTRSHEAFVWTLSRGNAPSAVDATRCMYV